MARRKRIEHDPIVRRFAVRLREQRSRLGLSQQDLALRAGANIGYIGKLERSEAAPGLDMVGRLAAAMSVRPEKLIASEAPPSRPLPVVRDQIQRQVRRIVGRDDPTALAAISVILGLLDNAMARQGRNT